MVDAAAVVVAADEGPEAAVAARGALAAVATPEIEAEDLTALPAALMTAAINGPEAVAVGFQDKEELN